MKYLNAWTLRNDNPRAILQLYNVKVIESLQNWTIKTVDMNIHDTSIDVSINAYFNVYMS